MKILSVFGTRPEAIKMAPVIAELNKDSRFKNRVCLSGQHRSMLDQVIDFFEIPVDHDLNIMRDNQSLAEVSAAILTGIDAIIKTEQPDLMLVHGDTNTTLSASLAAYYNRVKIGHIEAGLRTYDLFSPWPEEANRRITDLLSQKYFAPTDLAKTNLEKENIEESSIVVTGNTVIDALLFARNKIGKTPHLLNALRKRYNFLTNTKKLILVTGHRRENFGDGLSSICTALKEISSQNDVEIVYPVHKNPNVQDIIFRRLNNIANIHLIDPLDYPDFVYLMDRSHLILTDSGGIQEEAPSLNKPVLVMREVTERPEGIDAGTLKLVGTDPSKIIENVHMLLTDKTAYSRMAIANNPYGDGKAAKRIVDALYYDR